MGPLKPLYLLDTVILIDHFTGRESATRWLAAVRSRRQAVISVITRAEALAGGEDAQRNLVATFLDAWDCLPITAEIADLAASLRREYRWRLPDAFQAALARHHGLLLATRNTRDFPVGKYDFVKVPYRP